MGRKDEPDRLVRQAQRRGQSDDGDDHRRRRDRHRWAAVRPGGASRWLDPPGGLPRVQSGLHLGLPRLPLFLCFPRSRRTDTFSQFESLVNVVDKLIHKSEPLRHR